MIRAVRASVVLALSVVALAATARAQILIESLDGSPTPREIQSFKEYVKSVPLPTSNQGNGLVYGSAGATMEAIGTVYEISRDRELLDLLVRFADHALAARNDAATGRTIWTGKRELVWPNKKPDSGSEAGYSGTENGDVIAHIAYAAVLILGDPSVAAQIVADGDPLHFGATYGDRARTYVRECDRTIDSFILPWFVQPDTLLYHNPNSDGFAALGDRYPGQRNKPVPWNQQMMLNGGFQRLAEAHALLKDDPARVARYDAIVQASLDAFLADVERYDVGGHPCYKWTYGVGEQPMRHIEDGGHAGYDLLILRHLASGRYKLTPGQLLPFANTVRYVMDKGNEGFAWRVDGDTSGKSRARRALGPTYLYLADVAPEMYRLLAEPMIEQAKSKPYAAAMILRAKHKLAPQQSKQSSAAWDAQGN